MNLTPEAAERRKAELEIQRDNLLAFRDQKEFKQLQVHVQSEVDEYMSILLELPVQNMGDVAKLLEVRGMIKGLTRIKSVTDEAVEAIKTEIDKL